MKESVNKNGLLIGLAVLLVAAVLSLLVLFAKAENIIAAYNRNNVTLCTITPPNTPSTDDIPESLMSLAAYFPVSMTETDGYDYRFTCVNNGESVSFYTGQEFVNEICGILMTHCDSWSCLAPAVYAEY